MNNIVSLKEAQFRLPELVVQAAQGVEISISIDNQVRARIVPARTKLTKKREVGTAQGVLMKDDFKDLPSGFENLIP